MPTMPGLFRPDGKQSAKQVRQEADKRRGTARERGYTSRWDREATVFKRNNPLCLGCQAVGRTAAAVVVDHTMPHRGDQKLFWERANRQPSCKWHHDVVKQRLEQMHADGKIATDQLRLDSATAKELTMRLDPL